jgi:hypothetical protein
MTKALALKQFKQEIAPGVIAKYGRRDAPACREAWNNWTDGLQKDGQITRRQYDTWTGPKFCSVSRKSPRR